MVTRIGIYILVKIHVMIARLKIVRFDRYCKSSKKNIWTNYLNSEFQDGSTVYRHIHYLMPRQASIQAHVVLEAIEYFRRKSHAATGEGKSHASVTMLCWPYTTQYRLLIPFTCFSVPADTCVSRCFELRHCALRERTAPNGSAAVPARHSSLILI